MNPPSPKNCALDATALRHLALLAAMLLAGCTHQAGLPSPLHVPILIAALPQHPCEPAIPDLPNFGFVTRDVWRGGEPTAVGLQMLAKLGLKTVIDLRESGLPDTPPPGIRIVRLPVSAWQANSVSPDQLLAAIADNPKPVFIHCYEGRDRTGLAIAEYRLSKGMSTRDACRELRNFGVNPWWELPIERRIDQLQPLLSPKTRLTAKVG